MVFALVIVTFLAAVAVDALVIKRLAEKKAKVLAKRESESRPTQGIVTVETRGLNQDGKQVMIFERTMLVYKRGHSPEAAANY